MALSVQVLSEKTLPYAAKLIKYCPFMDLVALVTTDQQVFIYRLNGQRVYGASSQKPSTLKVDSIQWKPNGQLLAIAWSDGSIRIIGVESNQIVHQFTSSERASGVTCMSWSSSLTNKTSSSINADRKGRAWEGLLAVDDLGSLETDVKVLDLPRAISSVDVEISLPKLSALASAGSLDDVFCSRSSLDDLFRPFDPKDNNAVDVMVVGTTEGNIHLSIYDSFMIGSFRSPMALPSGDTCQLISHASDKHCSTHAMLLKPSAADDIYLVPMDLRFISASSDYLSLLASRSTALSNLLRYIEQVQHLMVAEWKATQDLPNRFLRNINETLGENGNRDIVQALYHSVATGHTFPAVREWLVDEVAERGHKRWDKAVTTGLDNLKRLVHENMLPALERCSVILSRFSGIARFQGSNGSDSFTSQQIGLIMDTVACLHLLASKILIQVIDELDLFTSFSAWLRYEIDRLASDDSSSMPDDTAEKESSIDHSKVLLYLQKVMMTSPLRLFLDDSEGETSFNQESGTLLFDALNKQIQKQERGLSYNKSLLKVDLFCRLLTQQASAVFFQIAEAEKRNVLFGKALHIGVLETSGRVEMKMSAQDGSTCQTCIAFIPRGSRNTIQFNRVSFLIDSGISAMSSTESVEVGLGGGEIKDIKFLDNDALLVLWSCKGLSYLLSIPYDPKLPASRVLSDDEVISSFQIHQNAFRRDDFAPEKLEIRAFNGQKDDRSRVVVLSHDRKQYVVFKFSEGGMDNDIRMT